VLHSERIKGAAILSRKCWSPEELIFSGVPCAVNFLFPSSDVPHTLHTHTKSYVPESASTKDAPAEPMPRAADN